MTYNRSKFKLSTIILSVIPIFIVAGVFATSLILKDQYNKLDKNDPYWEYTAILKQPFSHVKINGRNVTKIAFMQSNNPAVKVANYWDKAQRDSILKAHVANDTLYLDFSNGLKNKSDEQWMRGSTLVRIFAPLLLSVEGNNINFLLENLIQNNIKINIKGKSKLEVESAQPNFNSIDVTQRDSSIVEFEMSPWWKGSKTMFFGNVKADLKGPSALSIIYGDVKTFDLHIADESAIGLSGKSLKMLHK